jgi:hypothetical protein
MNTPDPNAGLMRLKHMTEPQLKNYFRALGNVVERALPPMEGGHHGKCNFVLLVADESNIAQYLANCRREDMVKFLRETADRLEQREDIPR